MARSGRHRFPDSTQLSTLVGGAARIGRACGRPWVVGISPAERYATVRLRRRKGSAEWSPSYRGCRGGTHVSMVRGHAVTVLLGRQAPADVEEDASIMSSRDSLGRQRSGAAPRPDIGTCSGAASGCAARRSSPTRSIGERTCVSRHLYRTVADDLVGAVQASVVAQRVSSGAARTGFSRSVATQGHRVLLGHARVERVPPARSAKARWPSASSTDGSARARPLGRSGPATPPRLRSVAGRQHQTRRRALACRPARRGAGLRSPRSPGDPRRSGGSGRSSRTRAPACAARTTRRGGACRSGRLRRG